MRKKQTKKRDFSIIGWGVGLSQEQDSHIQISLYQDKDNSSLLHTGVIRGLAAP